MTTIAEQWASVDEWRARLANSERFPVLDALESSWRALDAHGLTPPVERNSRNADVPLTDALFCIEMGCYPPPELMLALADSFRRYLDGKGAITLEEAFLGRPVQKAGTYAKRKARASERWRLAVEITVGMRNGLTKIAAAEEAGKRLRSPLDAASIARMIKPFTRTRKK